MVWGAITANGVGAIFLLEGSVNAAVYKIIITNGVIPTVELSSECSKNVVFQDESCINQLCFLC